MATEILEQVERKALSVPEQAKAFMIATPEQFIEADSLLVAWRGIEKEVHDAFDPIVDAAFKAHKEAVGQRKKYLDPIEQGRAVLKPKMAEYQREQERVRQEEQRKAEAEALARAEQEQIEAALAAEQAGEPEVAEQIISEPVAPEPVFVPKATPKTATTFRTQWYAEVTDIKTLCRAIADGRQPVALIEPNMPALNKMATALKSTLSIPGVVAKSKTV